MTVRELWLVRHGESIGNIAASQAEKEGLDVIPLDIRDADVPLSPTGEDQARALGNWLGGQLSAIDLFWISPYLRARQTLAIALGEAEPTVRVAVDERLRDRELGVLDLLTTHGVVHRHPEETARRKHLGKFYHRPPGGESWADVALRLRSFLGDALESPGETALIVAHDAVVMLLLFLLLRMDEAELLAFAASHTVGNASVTHVAHTADGWQLLEFSAVEHLSREGAAVTMHPGRSDVEPE